VEVGRDALGELGQRGIAVGAIAEVAQDLIERAVLLDDVDDVLDATAQELRHLLVVLAVGAVEVVRGHAHGQAVEIFRRRHRRADQGGALELELVLVRGPGRSGGRATDWRAAGTGNGDVGGVAGQVAGVRPVMLLPLTMYIQLPSALKVMSCGS